MQKKLQVFISSTFTDLVEERQVAVESVLNAGHIPAGMELFKSGDKTQKEVIKKWIDESDVYMLILGGRYGSIDEETGKSYTHWEYDYADEAGKPRFAVVISEEALEEKVRKMGYKEAIEQKSPKQYQEFKELVLGKISKFYSDFRDIKITVLESLKEYEKDKSLSGWISGKDIEENNNFEKDNHQLLKENSELKREIGKLITNIQKDNDIAGTSYNEIVKFLKSKMVTFKKDFEFENLAGRSFSILELFYFCQERFAVGITNRYDMSSLDSSLFFSVAPHLLTYSLVEKVKVEKNIQRIQTSKEGLKFLRIANSKMNDSNSKDELEERLDSQTEASTKKSHPKKAIRRKTPQSKATD